MQRQQCDVDDLDEAEPDILAHGPLGADRDRGVQRARKLAVLRDALLGRGSPYPGQRGSLDDVIADGRDQLHSDLGGIGDGDERLRVNRLYISAASCAHGDSPRRGHVELLLAAVASDTGRFGSQRLHRGSAAPGKHGVDLDLMHHVIDEEDEYG